MIGYVVLEAGWEYNDEYYYRPDVSGGMPRAVYTSQDKADASADRLNLDKFHDEFDDIFNGRKYEFGSRSDGFLQDMFEDWGVEYHAGEYGSPVPAALDDDQVFAVMEALDLVFYEVVSVPLS